MPDDHKNIVVRDETRAEATECSKGLACLQAEGAPLCSVGSCVGETIHFLECLNDQHCPYARGFGYGHYCTCPVRKEIYQRYKA